MSLLEAVSGVTAYSVWRWQEAAWAAAAAAAAPHTYTGTLIMINSNFKESFREYFVFLALFSPNCLFLKHKPRYDHYETQFLLRGFSGLDGS